MGNSGSSNQTTCDLVDLVASGVYDHATMEKTLPKDVYKRFQDCLFTGAPTPEADQKIIAHAIFKWARAQGATDFAHWFFPSRGGAGSMGGALGALKMHTLIDLDFQSKLPNKNSSLFLPKCTSRDLT